MGIRQLVGRWALFGALVALFALDWHWVATGGAAGFDEATQGFFFRLRDWDGSEWFTAFFKAITVLGSVHTVGAVCAALAVVPFCLLLAFGLQPKERRNASLVRGFRGFFMGIGLPIAAAVVVGGAAHTVLKRIEARPRPDELFWLVPEDGFSFPSGHSNISTILYLFLAIILGRMLIGRGHYDLASALRNALAIVALLIGVSRVYLGVHFPTDVLGGFALGGALLTLFMIMYDGPYSDRRPETIPPPEEGCGDIGEDD